jgi:hypothetical protein
MNAERRCAIHSLGCSVECGVRDAVCHIIAAHAAEGDLVKRTTELLSSIMPTSWRFFPSRTQKYPVKT